MPAVPIEQRPMPPTTTAGGAVASQPPKGGAASQEGERPWSHASSRDPIVKKASSTSLRSTLSARTDIALGLRWGITGSLLTTQGAGCRVPGRVCILEQHPGEGDGSPVRRWERVQTRTRPGLLFQPQPQCLDLCVAPPFRCDTVAEAIGPTPHRHIAASVDIWRACGDTNQVGTPTQVTPHHLC